MKSPARRPELAFFRAAVFGILMLTGIGIAMGQASDDPDVPDRYRVEVVLFTQPPIDPDRPEQPDPQAGPQAETMAWPLRRDDGGPLGYRQLPASQHSLGRAARRIDSREGFRVLWHTAWEQPGLGPARVQPVALPIQLRAEGISGFIRVYRQRFLHVETELRYAQAEDRHWVMSTSRRMRGGQQHYLDHPVLGLLVRVDRISPDTD
ncbi:CsiV family protein [Spiribacter sp. 221]|uniref:CsiV family protein n=1 Tax=Spiribacter onubensis TaxID=3122420 RepID=UPI00349F97DC